MILVLASGCLSQQTTPSPTPTVQPTQTRPHFELATFMYGLQTKGKIRIGVLDNAAPFSARDAAGKYAGFEPDLGRELARAIFGPRQDIDSVIEWVSVDTSTAVAALTSAQADAVLARLGASDERATVIDQSDAYFVTGERILIRSNNDEIKDLTDLDTKTVCVLEGTRVADHVDEANAFARTLPLDTYASCLGALQQGQVDAIAADEPTLWSLVQKDANTKLVGRPLTTERYAIGSKKNASGDRQGFLPFLNAWLGSLVHDGTWARLYAQDIAPLSHETRTSPAP